MYIIDKYFIKRGVHMTAFGGRAQSSNQKLCVAKTKRSQLLVASLVYFWTLGSPSETLIQHVVGIPGTFCNRHSLVLSLGCRQQWFLQGSGHPYAKPTLYFGNMGDMFLRKKAMFDIVCDLYSKGGSNK